MYITKESINERFIEAVNYLIESDKTLTKKQIAENLKIGGSRFSEILNCRMNVSAEILANFSSEYKIEIGWLLMGAGNMIIEHIEKKEESTLSIKNKTLDIIQHETQYVNTNIISIPIVDVSAAAGSGYFNSDHPETLGELNWPIDMLKKKHGNYYCGRVNGESMAPTLLHQDYIIFRLLSFEEWSNLKNNDVYFIVDKSGTSFVKRIINKFNIDGTIVCQSDNADKANFRDFNVQAEDISNIYHIEWRFSKDLNNINQMYYDRVDNMDDRLKEIEKFLKEKRK